MTIRLVNRLSIGSESSILLLLSLTLAAVDTLLFLYGTPSAELAVIDYLRNLANLDHVLHYLRQFEPIYPLAVASGTAFTGLPVLAAINVSRFVLTALGLFFIGKIVRDVTGRWFLAILAMVAVNASASFWSLSINLLRNLHALVLTLAFIWVLIRLLQEKRRSWGLGVVAALLLAAIVETHIVMAIVASGTLLMFFVLWTIRSFLPPRVPRAPLWKDFAFFGGLAIVVTLPYDYIRFYLQQFYRTHEFLVPASATYQQALQSFAVPGLGKHLDALMQWGYLLFVDVNPLSLHRIVYGTVLAGAVFLAARGLWRREPVPLFVSCFFVFTFLASRNDLLGIRILPDRFDLVLFAPAILLLFLFLEAMESSRWIARPLTIVLALFFSYLQLSTNAVLIMMRTHLGETDPTRYARAVGDPVIPDVLLAAITPDELRAGRYTGPTAIDGFEDSIVTRTPDSVEMFETMDASVAWKIARDLGVQYIYLDSLYDTTYHYALRRNVTVEETKFLNRRYFTPLYQGFTELSRIQLFRVRDTPGERDIMAPSFERRIVPAEVTSADATRTVRQVFEKSKVREWVTDFRVSALGVESLTEYIVSTDGTNYRLTNEEGLRGSVVRGLFSNHLIIERPSIPQFERWRVQNAVKGFITDGFILGSTSRNLAREISWRVERQGGALYNRFQVDPRDGARVEIIYLTASQFETIVSLALFLATVLIAAVLFIVDRWYLEDHLDFPHSRALPGSSEG